MARSNDKRTQRLRKPAETAKRPSAEYVRREMQKSLDEAWEVSCRDPRIKAKWDELFPDGRKPTLEEFIIRLSQEVSVESASLGHKGIFS